MEFIFIQDVVDHDLLDVVSGFIQGGKQVSLAVGSGTVQFYVLQFAQCHFIHCVELISWQNILSIACLHLT